jgi:low temperature requirement protein LtrA
VVVPFDRAAAEGLCTSPPLGVRPGYWHLLVFASLAAVGAGLQVIAETLDRHGSLSGRAAALTLAVPVALFLVVLGLLHSWVYRYRREPAVARCSATAMLVVVVAAVATPPLPLALTVALIGLIAASLVTADVVRPPRRRT